MKIMSFKASLAAALMLAAAWLASPVSAQTQQPAARHGPCGTGTVAAQPPLPSAAPPALRRAARPAATAPARRESR